MGTKTQEFLVRFIKYTIRILPSKSLNVRYACAVNYEDDIQGSFRRNDNTKSDVTGHHPAPNVTR
jgi:hypothetical protein